MTDTTGRGYGAADRKVAGTVSNMNTRSELPKPDMQSLLTQEPSNLDHRNRFFEDQKKKLKEVLDFDIVGNQEPIYSDKKQLATKVTSGAFTRMPESNIKAPKGFHDVRPSPSKTVKAAGNVQNDDE